MTDDPGAAASLRGVPATASDGVPETGRGLFETGRRLAHAHPLALDSLLALAVLAGSTLWLIDTSYLGVGAGLFQLALAAPLAVRRRWPLPVFAVLAVLGLAQWAWGVPLLADVALLVALYTVAVHETWSRALPAAVVLQVGAVLAAVRWDPAGTVPRSLTFLTATVVAALCAGMAVASGSRYLTWLDERARRLEVERDQQATIAAAAERTRMARELHDVVSHTLSVVITLADAAAVTGRSDPERSAAAMTEVAEAGRRALADMRTMLGVLRGAEPAVDLRPQPDVAQLAGLVDGVRRTGLQVDLQVVGRPFPLGAAAELSVYRIVQEALTNTLRHAGARKATVELRYAAPTVAVTVADDGVGGRFADVPPAPAGGHGIAGMRERAALHGASLHAGPRPGGGWEVAAVLHVGAPPTGPRPTEQAVPH